MDLNYVVLWVWSAVVFFEISRWQARDRDIDVCIERILPETESKYLPGVLKLKLEFHIQTGCAVPPSSSVHRDGLRMGGIGSLQL